jgi:hypothetical protein
MILEKGLDVDLDDSWKFFNCKRGHI